MNYQARRQSVMGNLKSPLLVSEAKNRRYLSGFSGSAGWLLLEAERATLFTDGRYWDQVKRECDGVELFKFVPKEHKDLANALVAHLTAVDHSGPIAIDTHDMTLATYRSVSEALTGHDISIVEEKNLITEARTCKDEQEIELLRTAAKIADRALAEALKEFGPGMRECDLKADLEYHIQKFGGTSTSFATIVASGPNGSYPHAGASERVVNEGELITIDFGAIYQGYCSDMTRTIWYGELDKESQNILRHTRKAQELAVAAVKPGVSYSELDGVARQYLAENDLGRFFVHSLGHGVGLDIHEAPGLRGTSEGELMVGQVVTIEPGVYLPGKTGCRVEDTVLVTKEGYSVVNQFPKQSLDSTSPCTD